MKRPIHESLYVLPLFGRARALREGREVPLSKKGLALLYYLALEGPTTRTRLADLLYGHGSGLQNLRVELHRLGKALGRAAFPAGQDPLVLPPWIRLDTAGQGEALEGLEEVGHLWDWVLEVRVRHERSGEVSTRQGLLQELAALRPPFLLVLRGRPGAGRRALAQDLARILALPFHETLRPEGVVYLAPPYPQGALRELLRSRAVLVLSLDPGEEPRFFLELRAAYPAERTRVLDLPPLGWLEARQTLLRDLGFQEAARAYFLSGGQPEWIPEWRVCAGFPQRLLAQLRLQARLLSEPARLALERLSVAPGLIPEEVLDALGALPHLDELERKGWLVYQKGYCFAKEAERRLLYAALTPGRRHELHERAATALALSGRFQEEAFHRLALGESAAIWGSSTGSAEQKGWRLGRRGLGPERTLLPQEESGVAYLGEGYALALLEPGEEAGMAFSPLEEALVLELQGEAYAPEALGLLLTLRLFREEASWPLEASFALRVLVPLGPLRLRFTGLGVAEFRLRAFRPRLGREAVWTLAPEEVEKEGEEKGKEEG
ncbi:hypothetical protein [Thermus thalpophilus]|uniref:hypothetical protein n=1 Tax=Thermus thalpophilus TaxID=2908147 RepID=UPI001FA99B22|nr:hypothetical protein [Thermus thalpophilus]